MSHALKISHAPTSIEALLRQANADLLEHGGDARTKAMVLEANQQYIEYLDELIDDIDNNPTDVSVSVSVGGVTMKFPTVDDMAAWLSDWRNWK